MVRIRTIQSLIAAALLFSGAASAQQCDDFSDCTANDMCSAGVCTGAFQAGSCDDGDPCTGGDTCVMDPEFGPICIGDQRGQVGAECQGGCGTCQELAPVPGIPLICVATADPGDPCDAGFENPCFEAQCQVVGVPPLASAFCIPTFKECPDTDGNLCNDACDFESGECETSNSVTCDPTCETCNTTTGECAPANVGGACDDFNECSPQSSCQTIGTINRTFCQPGEPTGPTPTSTVITGPTPTRTTGVPGECVGDCDNGGSVAINELILGVNISLGSAELSRCTAFDRNDSGGIEINELISGVNASLNGCA